MPNTVPVLKKCPHCEAELTARLTADGPLFGAYDGPPTDYDSYKFACGRIVQWNDDRNGWDLIAQCPTVEGESDVD